MKAFFRRTLTWFKKNEKALAAAGGILAAALSVGEYFNRKEDSRVQEALKYVERYQKTPILEARKTLDLFWLHPDQRKKLSASPEGVWKDLAAEAAVAHRHDESIYVVHSFYRDVAICTRKKVCDASTICSYMSRDIDSFRNLYVRVLDDWGKDWKENFTSEIYWLLDETCKNIDPAFVKK